MSNPQHPTPRNLLQKTFIRAAQVGATLALKATYPAARLYHLWLWTVSPIERFEPRHDRIGDQPLTPPYWQDLIFGEGRLEKLLNRLEFAPVIKGHLQKKCVLNSLGGLKIFPGNRALARHGLNDGMILAALDSVNTNVSYLSNIKKLPPELFDTLVMREGGIVPTDKPDLFVIQQKSRGQHSAMNLDALCKTYIENGFVPKAAAQLADRVAEDLYAWLYHDVLPAIPNAFGTPECGYNAIRWGKGGYSLTLLGEADFWEDEDQIIHKDQYAIFASGYKGARPATPARGAGQGRDRTLHSSP